MSEKSNKEIVLFLCTANAARSQIAEALLRKRAGDYFEAHSAGLVVTKIHPFALSVLNEIGIDTSPLYPKEVKTFLGKVQVRQAIVLCEHAQQNCPRLFPFAVQRHYWPFEDPALFKGTEEEVKEKFRETRNLIDERIINWLKSQGIPVQK